MNPVRLRIPKGSTIFDIHDIDSEYQTTEDIETTGILSFTIYGFYEITIDGFGYYVSMLSVDVLD